MNTFRAFMCSPFVIAVFYLHQTTYLVGAVCHREQLPQTHLQEVVCCKLNSNILYPFLSFLIGSLTMRPQILQSLWK